MFFICRLILYAILGVQNETNLFEDSLALPEMPSFQSKFVSTEDDYFPHNRLRFQPHVSMDSRVVIPSVGDMKQEIRLRPAPLTWLQKLVQL